MGGYYHCHIEYKYKYRVMLKSYKKKSTVLCAQRYIVIARNVERKKLFATEAIVQGLQRKYQGFLNTFFK